IGILFRNVLIRFDVVVADVEDLLGDQDPWLTVSLIVEMQAIGFRYNALCIYQRKKR
ncbi:unnamed protein product, partial [Rotaria sordida]